MNLNQSTGWGGPGDALHPRPIPRYAGGRPPSPPYSPLRIPRTFSVSLNEPNLFPIPIPIPGGSPLGPVGIAKQGEKHLIMFISMHAFKI